MRQVKFYKIQLATIIDFSYDDFVSFTRTICNENLSITSVLQNLIVTSNQVSFPKVVVNFEEIYDKLGATNIEEYLLEASNINLFVVDTTGVGGGSGGPAPVVVNYNDPDIYQLGDLTLPHTFGAGTLHSISITSTTGILTIEVNNVVAEVVEGATINYSATTVLDEPIEIVSTTGTYTITVLKQ